ncbi:hypothetical protein D9M68_696970 [compost metagenome]
MTPSKQQATLQGCTAIARKVYDAVPIQDAWQPIQIKNALATSTRSSTDLHVVRGCLRVLVESGLVREHPHGHYRRIEVRETKPYTHMEIVMPESNVTKTAQQPTQSEQSPIEILGELAGQITTLANEFAARMKKLAAAAEEAALAIEQERETNDENLGKLRQLQALLKSL